MFSWPILIDRGLELLFCILEKAGSAFNDFELRFIRFVRFLMNIYQIVRVHSATAVCFIYSPCVRVWILWVSRMRSLFCLYDRSEMKQSNVSVCPILLAMYFGISFRIISLAVRLYGIGANPKWSSQNPKATPFMKVFFDVLLSEKYNPGVYYMI